MLKNIWIAMKIAARVLGLLVAVAVLLPGFLWRRYQATRAFQRCLGRTGLPHEATRLLTSDFRDTISLSGIIGRVRRKD